MDRPPDLRLALGVLAAWIALLWGLAASALTVAIITGALLLIVGVIAIGGHRRPKLSVLAFAAATMALVLAPLAARLHQARDGQLAALARSRVAVIAELQITSDPRLLASHGTSAAPRSAVDAKLLALDVAGISHSASGSVLVLGPADAWRGVCPASGCAWMADSRRRCLTIC